MQATLGMATDPRKNRSGRLVSQFPKVAFHPLVQELFTNIWQKGLSGAISPSCQCLCLMVTPTGTLQHLIRRGASANAIMVVYGIINQKLLKQRTLFFVRNLVTHVDLKVSWIWPKKYLESCFISSGNQKFEAKLGQIYFEKARNT